MKQLIKTILNDYKAEGFTRKDYIIYGVLAPIAYLIIIIFASNI